MSRPFGTTLRSAADVLAVAVAISLPWSITAASFLIFTWLAVALSSVRLVEVRRELSTAAGGFPLALFVLGFVGMSWADVNWPERLGGMDAFFKLSMIPLLIAQFRHSDRGWHVMMGYLASCTVLLVISFGLMIWPPLDPEKFGIPVKTATTQSTEFLLCFLVLPFLAIETYRQGQKRLAVSTALLALAFLTNILCIVMATLLTRFFFILVLPFVAMPILLLLTLVKRKFGCARMIGVLATGVAVGGAFWIALPQLRHAAGATWLVVEDYSTKPESRTAYWRRSIGFIAEAPILGHGTGTTYKLFSRNSDLRSDAVGPSTTNPHQQTLAIGIQIGLAGMVLLWAMWIAHLLAFRDDTLPAWIGTVVVVQSITSSLLDTQLFDFTQGWTYVFGVGVAGGMVGRICTTAAEQDYSSN